MQDTERQAFVAEALDHPGTITPAAR